MQEASGASDDDLFATFNMGLGMLLVVGPEAAPEVLARSAHEAYRIGDVDGRLGRPSRVTIG